MAITGSVMMYTDSYSPWLNQQILIDWGYPKYQTVADEDPIDMKLIGNAVAVELISESKDKLIATIDGKMQSFTYLPGSEVDICVFGEEYALICERFIATMMLTYGARVEVSMLPNGTRNISDSKHMFRPIQLFRGSTDDIITYHLPVVRQWYGKFLDKPIGFYAYPSVSSRGDSPYYLLAGAKNPIKIFINAIRRNYCYQQSLPSHVAEIVKLYEDLLKIPFNITTIDGWGSFSCHVTIVDSRSVQKKKVVDKPASMDFVWPYNLFGSK